MHAASCRVRVSNARGTGIFNGYNEQTGKAYISTNDHVTSANRACQLDFWTNSKMETVAGSVVFKSRNDNTGRDFAIIEVDANELKKIDPPYIPMKSVDPAALVGRPFMSSGCPDGRFDQGWRGTIERLDGGMAIFSPPPVPGQSGSGICVVDGGRVYDVAKLTYLLGAKGQDESKGGALPLRNLLNGGLVATSAPAGYTRRLVADRSKELSILAFTSEDCPACEVAAQGLLQTETVAGYEVRRVDPLKKDEAYLASAYNVTEIPTFLIVDEAAQEIARATFADIKRLGSYSAIVKAISSAHARFNGQSEVLPPAPPIESTDGDDAGKRYRMGAENGVVVSEPGEIEKTIAVYITDPASYDFDAERVAATNPPAGLLRDLIERDRGDGRNDNLTDDGESEDTTPPPTPIIPRKRRGDNESDNESDAQESRGGIGARALDALAARLEKKIDGKIDETVDRAQGLLNDAGEEIGAKVSQTIGERLASAWRVYRARFVCVLFAVVFLAVIAARVAFGAIGRLYTRAKEFAALIAAANAASRDVTKGGKE
ncbi:hypothetical protein IJ103_00170 [Candidatus Saccharibacteria bacterium]|nr:hypothetical protein [Candidatus Saccharibacteria bacterium]